MEVPISKRSVQVEAPGVVTPRLAPLPEGAFGAEIGQAKSQMGNTIMSGAARLGDAIAKRKAFDEEQAVHDALQPVQQEMYQKTQGKDGFATLQGAQARGATDKFMEEYKPAKEKFIQQFKDPRQASLASKQYDAIYNSHLSSVISNEGRQTSIAEQEGLASSAKTAAQAAAVNPRMLPSDDPIWKAALGRTKEYYEQTYGPERAALEVQKFNDMAATERVKVHPEDAEKMMKMDLSPEGRAVVRGVQLDQMVKKDFLSLGKEFKMPDGSFNLDKVQDKYKEDKDLNSDEAQRAFENFSSMETRATRVLSEDNKSNAIKFYDVASNPATDLDDAKKAAMAFASKLRNGQLDHNDLRIKLKFIDEINKEANGVTDPAVFNRLYQGIDKDGDVTAQVILNERENGTISKSAMKSLTQFLYSQKSEVMRNRMDLIMKSDKVVSLAREDQQALKASITQEAISQRITNPDDLQKIANSMIADVPSGNKGFWGRVGVLTGYTDEPMYKRVGVMSQHPEIVRAAGSPQAAVAFAQRVGGIGKFDDNVEYAGAVSYLLSKGWTLDNMTQEALEKVAARLAEKKNGKP